MTFTSALHTYFYVKDIDAVSLKDVSSLKYIDNLRNDKVKISLSVWKNYCINYRWAASRLQSAHWTFDIFLETSILLRMHQSCAVAFAIMTEDWFCSNLLRRSQLWDSLKRSTVYIAILLALWNLMTLLINESLPSGRIHLFQMQWPGIRGLKRRMPCLTLVCCLVKHRLTTICGYDFIYLIIIVMTLLMTAADEEFKNMVCVEAGSIGTPSKVAPLQEISMHMKLSCEYYDTVPSSAIWQKLYDFVKELTETASFFTVVPKDGGWCKCEFHFAKTKDPINIYNFSTYPQESNPNQEWTKPEFLKFQLLKDVWFTKRCATLSSRQQAFLLTNWRFEVTVSLRGENQWVSAYA